MQQHVSTTNFHGNNVVMVPRHEYQAFKQWRKYVLVQLDEAWFWTKQWQRKEATADRAIKAGKVSKPFSDHDSLLCALKGKR